MRTIKDILNKVEDSTLLNIYSELESGVVPATGYAHEFCRRINDMIDRGSLRTLPDKYRRIYLPTLSKLVFKEMARRYALHCYNTKTLEDERDGSIKCKCAWCDELVDAAEVHMTDHGVLCDTCIAAIRSRGETVAILYK